MNNINILNFRDIDVNNIMFSDPEKIKGGSYISIPKYNSNPIYIQTPRLVNKGLTKNEQKCTLELELDNTHLNFYEFITNIDDFNIVNIQKNSLEWFKQEFPLDVVEEFYKSPVKMARSKKAPSLKVKMPLSKGNIDCNIYNNQNQLINYSQIKDNSKVLTVLHFYGLRFLKQQVICEWVPVQIKIFDDTKDYNDNYLIDDSLLSDHEDNDLENNQDNNLENNQDNNLETTLNNDLETNKEDCLENNQDNDLETTLDNDLETNLDEFELSSNISTTDSNDLNLKDFNNLQEQSLSLESKVNDSNKIMDLEQTILNKNNRIKLLENKIRELYKYLS